MNDDDLNDRLITAIGPEPQPETTTNASGDEIAEDPELYLTRYEAWRATFEPQDLADADHCARRYRQASARAGAIDALARDQIRAIEEWAKREREQHDRDIGFWAGRLELFHRAQRTADPKRNKTMDLPCGVQLRSQAGKIRVEIVDEAKAIAWLEHNGTGCIEYPPARIVKAALSLSFGGKANGESEPGTYPAVSAEGEVVPGVEFIRGDTTFTVR